MKKIGQYNKRDFYYLAMKPDDKRFVELIQTNLTNFMYMVIIGKTLKNEQQHIAKACITNKPLFIHCCGTKAMLFEEIIHNEIVDNALEYERLNKKEFDYDSVPQTSSDNDLKDAVTFSAIGAFHEQLAIDNVFVIDFEANENTESAIIAILKTI